MERGEDTIAEEAATVPGIPTEGPGGGSSVVSSERHSGVTECISPEGVDLLQTPCVNQHAEERAGPIGRRQEQVCSTVIRNGDPEGCA